MRRDAGITKLRVCELEPTINVARKHPERLTAANIGGIGLQEPPQRLETVRRSVTSARSMYPLATRRARSLRRASNNDL
jgi:hypothetical protein